MIASVHYDIPQPVDRNAPKLKVKKGRNKIKKQPAEKGLFKKNESQTWNGLGMMIPGWIGFGLFSIIALFSFLMFASYTSFIILIPIIAGILAFIGLVLAIIGTVVFVNYKKE